MVQYHHRLHHQFFTGDNAPPPPPHRPLPYHGAHKTRLGFRLSSICKSLLPFELLSFANVLTTKLPSFNVLIFRVPGCTTHVVRLLQYGCRGPSQSLPKCAADQSGFFPIYYYFFCMINKQSTKGPLIVLGEGRSDFVKICGGTSGCKMSHFGPSKSEKVIYHQFLVPRTEI